MLAFLAALSLWPPKVWWWSEFQHEYKRCGIVFNVDGSGPVGDGVRIEDDYSGLVLSRSHARSEKPLHCIDAWAKKVRLKVRYQDF